MESHKDIRNLCVRTILGVALICLSIGSTCRAELTPQKGETFFLLPGVESTVSFDSQTEIPAEGLAYSVTDYWGREVMADTVKAAGKVVSVALALPDGYYDLTFPASKETFGIVVSPELAGPRDPFFCIDAGLSWSAKDPEVRRNAIAMLKRCGVDILRDRLWWGAINSGPGKFNFEGDCQYESVRKEVADQGMKTLELFSDAPSYLGRTNTNPFPQDMVGTATAWGQIATKWKSYYGAVEAWNEPDSGSVINLPADQYVPLVKAMSIGFSQAGVKVPLGGGVFTGIMPQAYLEDCARSGMLDYVDFVSYHNYDTGASIQPQVERFRDWLRANGHETMPLWITECGMPWKSGSPRPSIAEDTRTTLEIVDKAIEARACGIARYFPFYLMPYAEGPKEFGMLGKNHSPLRSLGCYARCIVELSHKSYLGDLKAIPAGVKTARVFADNREAVAVLYTGAAKAGATVKLDFPVERVRGIDGRALKVQNGTIPLDDGLVYVTIRRDRVAAILNTKTRAAALTAATISPIRRGTIEHERKMPPIILQYLPDLKNLRHSSIGYDASGMDTSKFPIRMRVSNLSDEKRSVTLALFSVDQGLKLDFKGSPAGRVITNLPKSLYTKDVEVPARGVAEASWNVDLLQIAAGLPKQVMALATADGVLLDRIVFRITMEQTLEQNLAAFRDKTALPIDKMDLWKKNVVADATLDMSAVGTHWLMKVKFDKGDPWAYPVFELPANVDLANATGLVIEAKAGGPCTVNVIVREKNNSTYFTGAGIIPADGNYHSALIRFSDLVPLLSAGPPDDNGKLDRDEIRAIMVGMNSNVKENSLEVSHIYVVGGEK